MERWYDFSGMLLFLSMVIPAAQDLTRYPNLQPDVQAHYLSSFDRTGGNDDGFEGTYSALYTDEDGELVIFDVAGPGTLWNLWFTSRVDGRGPLGAGRLKFYFDDEVEPRVDMDIDEFFSGRHPPFVPPFVYHAFQSTGGYVSTMPFPFQKRLRITTERKVGFYNAYYHTFAPDRAIESWTEAASAAPTPEIVGEIHTGTIVLDAPDMPDGEPVPSRKTLLEHEGSGAITALRIDPLFPVSAYWLNHVWLRIYWDGAREPAVDAPLGSFFGSGLGEASVRALPLGMSPSGPYYCHLPMPFWDGFRIELVSENPERTPAIWWEVRVDGDAPYARESSGYLHARYRREWPTTLGTDYRLLDTDGRGVYVGQTMTVEPLRSEVKRWWEGDLRIYLDERRQPAFHGTGHEDEYLGGWSNEWLMNPYSLPMHGEPKTTELTQVDFQWSAATTVYRFFPGGIPFQRGISVSTEHGTRNSVDAMYSSVAYYYAQSEAMEKIGEIDVDGPIELTSQFEGRDDDVDVTDRGRVVSERSRFTFDVPPGFARFRLRRLFDQSSPQEAEVWIGGTKAGVWYTATTNEHKRWAEADYLLPASLTAGKERLEVEFRMLRPGWNEFRYELWGIP
ncbi:MAG TPA: glycoside hydrolase family 172 protein [Vicinamibacteria bacterium]|nr:glycoside hydrolase family 172 protein [Vicinamibacteria bacterium]